MVLVFLLFLILIKKDSARFHSINLDLFPRFFLNFYIPVIFDFKELYPSAVLYDELLDCNELVPNPVL